MDKIDKKKNQEKNLTSDVNGRYGEESGKNNVPGINTPGIALPAYNPPVPNRAWTAMRQGKDVEELSPEEKRELYLGRDSLL